MLELHESTEIITSVDLLWLMSGTLTFEGMFTLSGNQVMDEKLKSTEQYEVHVEQRNFKLFQPS